MMTLIADPDFFIRNDVESESDNGDDPTTSNTEVLLRVIIVF